MSILSAQSRALEARSVHSSSINHLQRPATPVPPPRSVSIPRISAYLAGVTFTLASAATNLTYAVTKADMLPQQITWGAVAVAASIVLALAPGAVVQCLNQRKYGTALVALAATMLFGAYSVTAALGSATGGRLVAEVEADDVAGRRQLARKEIGEIERELATLSLVRPVAVAQAEITAVYTRTPGLTECRDHDPNWRPTKAHREACKAVASLDVEKASATRKSELEQRLSEIRREFTGTSGTKAIANTDAVALQGFAKAFGMDASPEVLNRLLVVLSVLVIELGGGLAFAVAQGLRVERVSVDHVDPTPADITEVKAQEMRVIQGDTDGDPIAPAPLLPVDSHAGRLIRLLQDRGGQVIGGQRAVASLLNTSQATVNRTLRELVDTGKITVEADKKGTSVKLLAQYCKVKLVE